MLLREALYLRGVEKRNEGYKMMMDACLFIKWQKRHMEAWKEEAKEEEKFVLQKKNLLLLGEITTQL